MGHFEGFAHLADDLAGEFAIGGVAGFDGDDVAGDGGADEGEVAEDIEVAASSWEFLGVKAVPDHLTVLEPPLTLGLV